MTLRLCKVAVVKDRCHTVELWLLVSEISPINQLKFVESIKLILGGDHWYTAPATKQSFTGLVEEVPVMSVLLPDIIVDPHHGWEEKSEIMDNVLVKVWEGELFMSMVQEGSFPWLVQEEACEFGEEVTFECEDQRHRWVLVEPVGIATFDVVLGLVLPHDLVLDDIEVKTTFDFASDSTLLKVVELAKANVEKQNLRAVPIGSDEFVVDGRAC